MRSRARCTAARCRSGACELPERRLGVSVAPQYQADEAASRADIGFDGRSRPAGPAAATAHWRLPTRVDHPVGRRAWRATWQASSSRIAGPPDPAKERHDRVGALPGHHALPRRRRRVPCRDHRGGRREPTPRLAGDELEMGAAGSERSRGRGSDRAGRDPAMVRRRGPVEQGSDCSSSATRTRCAADRPTAAIATPPEPDESGDGRPWRAQSPGRSIGVLIARPAARWSQLRPDRRHEIALTAAHRVPAWASVPVTPFG